LEQALAQAPSAALVMGHNGIFRNDASDALEGSFQQCDASIPSSAEVNFHRNLGFPVYI